MKNTRVKILNAAFVLMLKKGYNAVSTRDITNFLGVTASLPYRYFSSKRELLFEASKLYFCDRYFGGANVSDLTMREMLCIIEDNMRDIVEFGSDSGIRVNVAAYNKLYLEALQSDGRFREHIKKHVKIFRKSILRAIESGELKPLSDSFISRIILDISGRCDMTVNRGKGSLKEIIDDLENFYALIKAD